MTGEEWGQQIDLRDYLFALTWQACYGDIDAAAELAGFIWDGLQDQNRRLKRSQGYSPPPYEDDCLEMAGNPEV
jgi:hypothetical protein